MLSTRLLGTAGLAMLIGLTIASVARSDDDDAESARIRVGFQIAPVPLNYARKNRGLVGLGSYIMNAQGGCNDCHTYPAYAPGGDPFMGQPPVVNSEQYMTGGRQFGPFTSRNLTPDEFGRPAGLTFEEFKNVLRTGAEPDRPAGSHLPPILQVMPWPVYGLMTSRDLRAIYEYLRAIPSRPDNPAPGP
jgi:mono/diheme cytochrome c family protein